MTRSKWPVASKKLTKQTKSATPELKPKPNRLTLTPATSVPDRQRARAARLVQGTEDLRRKLFQDFWLSSIQWNHTQFCLFKYKLSMLKLFQHLSSSSRTASSNESQSNLGRKTPNLKPSSWRRQLLQPDLTKYAFLPRLLRHHHLHRRHRRLRHLKQGP